MREQECPTGFELIISVRLPHSELVGSVKFNMAGKCDKDPAQKSLGHLRVTGQHSTINLILGQPES
jgi:hypothetical protein